MKFKYKRYGSTLRPVIPITIRNGENEAGHMMTHGLVGQRGFFEHFVVKFDLTEEEIELRQKS